MRKQLVTRTWIAGLAVMALGILVTLVGVGVMLGTAGTWTGPAGDAVFHPHYDSTFWTTVMIAAAGGLVILVGLVLQFIAWIGAMMNTARSTDKTWFILLLLLGLFGFGFIIMLVYVLSGPDVAPPPPLMTYPPTAPPPARAA